MESRSRKTVETALKLSKGLSKGERGGPHLVSVIYCLFNSDASNGTADAVGMRTDTTPRISKNNVEYILSRFKSEQGEQRLMWR